MSKLFTFYNTEIEDSHLVSVYDKDEDNYEIMWGGWTQPIIRSKKDIDDGVKRGVFQIVEDFRKQPSKTVEDVAKLVLEREMKQGGIIWKMNNNKLPNNLFSVSINHSINLPNREFKTIREAIEYLQKLEELFGEQ